MLCCVEQKYRTGKGGLRKQKIEKRDDGERIKQVENAEILNSLITQFIASLRNDAR